jgi:hypothetical protein
MSFGTTGQRSSVGERQLLLARHSCKDDVVVANTKNGSGNLKRHIQSCSHAVNWKRQYIYSRVTRLGELSSTGWLFTFGSFFNDSSSANLWTTFSQYIYQLCINFDKKNIHGLCLQDPILRS